MHVSKYMFTLIHCLCFTVYICISIGLSKCYVNTVKVMNVCLKHQNIERSMVFSYFGCIDVLLSNDITVHVHMNVTCILMFMVIVLFYKNGGFTNKSDFDINTLLCLFRFSPINPSFSS